MKLTIEGKEIELKQTFRAFMIYENIQGEAFAAKSLTDILVFFYSIILACSQNYDFTWDMFIDMIDADPNLVTEFSTWLTASEENNAKLSAPVEKSEEAQSGEGKK